MTSSIEFFVSDGTHDKIIRFDDIDLSLLINEDDKIPQAVNNLLYELVKNKDYFYFLGKNAHFQFLIVEAATRFVEYFKNKTISGEISVKLEDVNRHSPFFLIVFCPDGSIKNKDDAMMDKILDVIGGKLFNIPSAKVFENASMPWKLKVTK